MLRSVAGEHLGEDFKISNEPLIIGRRESCAIVLAHTKVSRSHAKVYMEGGYCKIVDLESSNGTYVNGIKLRPGTARELGPGDEIRITETILRYFDSDIGLPKEDIPGHTIIELLAEGGMGKIYRARQMAMDRDVAIKILNPEYAARKEFVGRFIQEARAAGKLNHPNIIQVHNVGKVGEATYYFTMELVKGANLTQKLGSARGLDLKTIINTGVKVADALYYAHERGVIHQDVKPDNIVIADNGDVKLADLGIAKTSETQDSPDGRKRVLGTPHYMSPEQASGKPVDGRSDIYSLGATLYHMLSGEPLFDAPKSTEVMAMHVRQRPRSLADAAPDVPGYICEIVDKMLAKNPDDRYKNAAETRDALAAALAKLEKAGPSRKRPPAAAIRRDSRVGSRPVPAVSSARTGKSSNTAQFGVFAGVVAILLIGAFFLASGSSNGRNRRKQQTTKKTDPKITAWKDAEAAFERGDLEDAKNKFSRIMDRFSDDPVIVKDAQKSLNEVNRAIRRKKWQERAKKAWVDFEQFKKRNRGDSDAIISRLNSMRKRYPSLEKKIGAELALARKTTSMHANTLFSSMENRVNTLIRTKDFDGAIKVIRQFRDRNPNHPQIGRLGDLEDKVSSEAEKALIELRKDIAGLRADKNYPGISARCSRFKREIKYRSADKEIAEIKAKIEQEIRARFTALTKPVYKHLEKRDFSAAQSVLDKQRTNFLTPPFNRKIRELDDLINGLRRLHLRAIREINKNTAWSVPKESTAEHLKGMDVIGADRFGLKVKRGPVSTTVKWSKLTCSEIAQVYTRYIPANSKYRKYITVYKQLFVK